MPPMYEDVEGWPWMPSHCPCDQQFIEWLNKKKLPESVIMHMGTGLHHKVGIEACRLGHMVIGLTISREEVISRVFRANVLKYQVFYSSLQDLDLRLVPKFDIITLFHFGEALGDYSYEVLEHIIGQTNPGARIAFYNRSAGWGNSQPAIEKAISRGQLILEDIFQELEIYRVDV